MQRVTLMTALVFVLPVVLTAAPVPASFQVTGAVAAPRTWSVDQIQHDFQSQIQTIHYTLKGKDHTAHAVSLMAVIDDAKPQLKPHIKNHKIQYVVEVLGKDGYGADFSLAELDPDLGNGKVWLAIDEDGQPFSDDMQPCELICPNDVKPARWVHGVSTINLIDMTQVQIPVAKH